ncbi:MAG: Biopolymer transport protein ExbD/TolR [Myxococcales bacterium]|nr:Biopolymer transport protein ExbD/TolR [Myxococcales bacterium]
MGMSTGGNKGGVQSEINVTPLIDVLLVLLIIFLVVMPIMMKMETLQVPRKITDQEMVASDLTQLTVKVKDDLSIVYSENEKEQTIVAADLVKTLRARLDMLHTGNDKVVFVDFDDGVQWATVVSTMDTIRAIAADVNHDEIKVALKVREDQPPK